MTLQVPHVNFGGLGGSGEPAMPTSSRAESVRMPRGQPRLKIRPEARERRLRSNYQSRDKKRKK